MTGQFCWIELMTRDSGAARGFYADLFGWSYRDEGPDGGPSYHVFEPEAGGPGGGIMTAPEAEIPTAWMPYVAVDDLEGSLDHARRLGGTVKVEPMEVPGWGRFAVIQDPSGGVLGLWRAKG